MKIYELVKMTLLNETGGAVGLPTSIVNEPNIWFEYKEIIIDAESEINKEQKDGKE